MPEPTVSIVLPIYNRAAFLPQALASIRGQRFEDWELIVVDDGSTDNSRAILDRETAGMTQSFTYIYQENQGMYGARNAGLSRARGRYLAFFDSDDVWLSHHLHDCVASLDTNSDVDWIYAACRIVDWTTGKEMAPDSFRIQGRTRPFLSLHTERRGDLYVLDDPASLECQLRDGLYCGVQNAVMRPSVFAGRRYRGSRDNVAEDEILLIKALAGGVRLAYFDRVHVIYHVHRDNSSAAAKEDDRERRVKVYAGIAAGLEDLRREGILKRAEQRALEQRLSVEYFWHLGYNLHWQHGYRAQALSYFWRGIKLTPGNWRLWKTFLLALIRVMLPFSRRRQ
ncbi:MAG: glycosyltransferase family 2 protein [Gemmataceae bacterium]